MKHLVSRQGQQSGPYSLTEIAQRVRAKELDLFDYVFVEEQSDWVLLMEYAPLAARLKENKPGAPPKIGTGTKDPQSTVTGSPAPGPSTVHAVGDWYVLKGGNRFGPFSYMDVVGMLQQKIVYPFDFIWHGGLKEWQRVAELSDFTQEAIRQLHQAGGTGTGVFIQRQFQRKKYGARVIVHDNRTLWKGKGFEISRGGAGLSMQNSLITPGQTVNVHFASHEGWPSFNAVCEVVSKKFVTDDSPVEYGVRFLSLSQAAQDEFYKKAA